MIGEGLLVEAQTETCMYENRNKIKIGKVWQASCNLLCNYSRIGSTNYCYNMLQRNWINKNVILLILWMKFVNILNIICVIIIKHSQPLANMQDISCPTSIYGLYP